MAISRRLRKVGCSALASASLFVFGCSDVSHFSTAPGESYCGAITLKFRQNLSPLVQMRLLLDASAIDVDGASGGQVSTYEAAEAPGGAATRLLDAATLRPIPPLLDDALSQLQFGDGREKNAIFAASPADASSESMLAVVSLRSDDTVEVRLIRAGLDNSSNTAPPGRLPLYGLFTLTKQPGSCGF